MLDEMIMFALCTTPTSFVYYTNKLCVLDQQALMDFSSASSPNNSPRIDLRLHSDVLSWLGANQSLLLFLNTAA
jgi:hypothetical protein